MDSSVMEIVHLNDIAMIQLRSWLQIAADNSMSSLVPVRINSLVELSISIIQDNRKNFYPPLITIFSLILQCCTYEGLRFSQEVGTTSKFHFDISIQLMSIFSYKSG